MNIEKIKWCIERAEGFGLSKIRNNTIEMIDICGLVSYAVESLNRTSSKVPWENVYKPLFLIRTIEGINRDYCKDGNFWIEQGLDFIQVVDKKCNYEQFDFENYEDIDEAKQVVIDYVYDQRVKK